jgi:hypothetical protein
MHRALELLFEESVYFSTRDGTPIDGGVLIGGTEFLPLDVLKEDPAAYQAESDNWLNETWYPSQEEARSQVLALHSNQKRYRELQEATKRQQVIPFIGSGMSVESGLPVWSELLRKLRRNTAIEPTALEALLNYSKFEEAADLVVSGMNRNLFDEQIEYNLRIDEPENIAGAVRLIPAVFSGTIVTTNLDNILERHYGMCACSFDQVLTGQDLRRYRRLKSTGSRFLLKLHGDIRRPETRVLLTAEYEEAYGDSSEIRTELSLLYRTFNLLFMGCSLGPDRTVGLIDEVATVDSSMPKHYAFLESPDSDLTRIEREGFLTSRRIYPIWYEGDHDGSTMALLSGLLNDQ